MNQEKLHNEPYHHFFLKSISFWHNQIWFNFESNHTSIEYDEMRDCNYEVVNGYTLHVNIELLEKIPDDYYCLMSLNKINDFRLDSLIDDFKRNCLKVDRDFYLGESISKHPIKK